MKKRLPKSIRKFIRREKARLRFGVKTKEEYQRGVSALYARFKKAAPASTKA